MKKYIFLLLLIPALTFSQNLKSFISKDSTEIFYEDIGKGKTLVLLSGGPGLNSDYLKEFYESHGFTAKGDEYMEDGIPHTAMYLDL